MDQVRPQPIQWPCDHANVDWSAYPLQTPSGGGRAPTPYRSETRRTARRNKGLTFRGPLQKDGLSAVRNPSRHELRMMGIAQLIIRRALARSDGSSHPT